MYIGYWCAVAGYLWYQIWREGRLALRWNGNTVWESQRAIRMREAKQLKLQNRLQASQVVADEKVAQPGPSSLPN
jgi:high-affinity iron transporter